MSINVRDAEEAVVFYTKLFGVGPAKQRPGDANSVVADPPMKLIVIVIEGEGEPGTTNHVGIEVTKPRKCPPKQCASKAGDLRSRSTARTRVATPPKTRFGR